MITQKIKNLAVPTIVTIILMVGFFCVLAYLIKFEVPLSNKDILLILVGVLSAKFSDAVGFWVNSSMGSHNKDALLANSTPMRDAKDESKP